MTLALALPTVVLALSAAAGKTIGLLAIFLGIGVLVNVIVLIIAFQIRGERQQNRAQLTDAADRRRAV